MIDDLTPPQRESLDALRASRGACPSAETLVAYEALSAADRARHSHHAHIVACSRCQLALHHMAEPVTASSSAAMKWALPIAAVLAVAIGFTLVDRRNVAPVAPAVDTVRGTEIQPTGPGGAVEIIREFAWQSPIRAARYRVTVRRGSTVVWETETTGLSVAPPPPGVIQRDVQYEWQVEAIDREGNVRMTSPPQPFSVY